MFDHKNLEREIERSNSSSDAHSSSSKKSKKKMRSILPGFFRRIKANKDSWRWKLKYLGSAFKWKRVNLQLSFFDDVLFKIVSVLEAIVLVASLAFFFLCCGCHF
ncbi:hypothetical protein Tsubulata_028138 [Turnera subulata]|uniref:Transmembrane protein n=1 Tax=Turnera subulata TaxID=218843 RepID=A0A9Q0JC39_9ROSI|nr:hypothetical protein Tsubulata_028138 [Turnera subulata]